MCSFPCAYRPITTACYYHFPNFIVFIQQIIHFWTSSLQACSAFLSLRLCLHFHLHWAPNDQQLAEVTHCACNTQKAEFWNKEIQYLKTDPPRRRLTLESWNRVRVCRRQRICDLPQKPYYVNHILIGHIWLNFCYIGWATMWSTTPSPYRSHATLKRKMSSSK